jgi:hypothetical protein
MKNKFVLLAALALLVTMTGCAVRFSAEVKNPWQTDVHQSAKPAQAH